ncbi:heme/hemin ABC transporter substrate-binding protein [Cytophaga aurantiaca]|uniref:heme/hemin ABC transporter substrate-binding protein n=1 Tax=Cytophaga aurantiaca TaxID=29530 RepID=UPI000370DD31|nr:ABC transporter substrate-binding protein [Cytophaga aurantiaca]
MRYFSIKKTGASTAHAWRVLPVVCIVFLLTAFRSGESASMKIVSVNGTMSEIICSLGLESSLVGIDVTSTYPASLDKVAKIGHNRSVSSEGIVALAPSLVVGMQNDLKPTIIEQLTSSNIKTKLFTQDLSIEGTKKLITEAGVYFNQPAKAAALIAQLDKDIASVKKPSVKKKVLFIYARGAGSMMVSGTGTSVDKIIQLSGGQNAVTSFVDYKPLTAEALLAANPDVILLFDSGLESVGGVEGLLKVQGIAQTNAGKNKKIVTMDGQLLTGFGPRLGKAMIDLSSKLQ